LTFWDTIIWEHTIRQWSTALAVAAGTFTALHFFRSLILRRLKHLAAREQLDVTDLLYSLVEQTKTLSILVLSLAAGSLFLGLARDESSWLEKTALVLLVLQVGFWLTVAIDYFVARRVQAGNRGDPTGAATMGALRQVLKFVVWAAVLLLVLENLGVSVNTMIASLGITGIAVGLAVQNILGDLFASLSIALDQPFVIGDFIEVDQYSGTVEHVGLKSTRLRSVSGEQLIISNSDLLSSRIRNFKRMARRRAVFTLNVAFSTPAEVLEQIPGWVREIVEGQEQVTFERAHFKTIGDFGLHFEVVYYLDTADYKRYMDVQQAVNLAVLRLFDRHGIKVAAPVQRVEVTGLRQSADQPPEGLVKP